MVPLLITFACVAPIEAEVAVERVLLPVGGEAAGVSREVPLVVREGIENEAPTVAVDTSGGLWSAVTSSEAGEEVIRLRQPDGVMREVARAPIASNPRLAAGEDGSVWLAWVQGGYDGSRDVWLQRVDGTAESENLTHGGWNAHPALAVADDGAVHLAWEEGLDVIVYGHGAERKKLGGRGLKRRPDVVIDADGPVVLFDELQLTRGLDPDYDIAVWRPAEPPVVLHRPGIQAAPRGLADPDGGLLIACHDSESTGGIVKWLRLFHYEDGAWSSWVDPRAGLAHEGEIQGAEFPALDWTEGGGLVVVTRSSHGHQVHLVSSEGISDPVDLTRSYWGARGWRQDLVVAGSEAWVARRARKEALVERLSLPKLSGLPDFEPVSDAPVIDVEAPAKPAGVAFGDVHMHSALSDGTGPPDEILARAWSRRLDFAVLTDHDTIVGSQLSYSDHDEIRQVTEWFGRRPGFVTLHGFEWTTPPTWRDGSGHRNVYFRDQPVESMELDGMEGLSRGFLPSAAGIAPDAPALNAALADHAAFTAPHHTSWTGTDWEHFDPAIQRQFELISVHGLSERPGEQVIAARGHEGGSYASDGLSAGLVFGFLGGSDGHGLRWHHGIGRVEDPWATGLTGVRCDPCTRESVWDALHARHSWATSGGRLVVDLRVGEAGPGDEVVIEGPLELAWSGTGTLVRDGVVLGTFDGGYVDAEADIGPHSYYLSVTDGEDHAWTSPIFVERR
ncbi:MAG TPA: DUF3604 domain-containing protein [Myxococcota bacterium]|nr:DUF3604 domain-containing protein [Myxococcota bacterium]